MNPRELIVATAVGEPMVSEEAVMSPAETAASVEPPLTLSFVPALDPRQTKSESLRREIGWPAVAAAAEASSNSSGASQLTHKPNTSGEQCMTTAHVRMAVLLSISATEVPTLLITFKARPVNPFEGVAGSSVRAEQLVCGTARRAGSTQFAWTSVSPIRTPLLVICPNVVLMSVAWNDLPAGERVLEASLSASQAGKPWHGVSGTGSCGDSGMPQSQVHAAWALKAAGLCMRQTGAGRSWREYHPPMMVPSEMMAAVGVVPPSVATDCGVVGLRWGLRPPKNPKGPRHTCGNH